LLLAGRESVARILCSPRLPVDCTHVNFSHHSLHGAMSIARAWSLRYALAKISNAVEAVLAPGHVSTGHVRGCVVAWSRL
jgi:hypothetical protein